ncbi:lysozyme [Pseudoxanthomonas suwonensis]|nr:lysozyme [Pseudoxanthomonas suwonensis]
MDTMHMSNEGLAWLKKVEGKSLVPYDDQTGKPVDHWVQGATIGYGHLITSAEWPQYRGGIDEAAAEALLRRDLAPFENAVNQGLKVPQQQNQFDALVALAYNIGTGAFLGSSVLRMINDPGLRVPAYPTLEQAWKAWSRSQGRENRGLANRRAAEWTMYSEGRYTHW